MSIRWFNKVVSLLLVAIFCSYFLYGQEAEFPSSLRGGISVKQKIIDIALEMQAQGWAYTMPRPKSPQARWGNTDGRTTWWNGYWLNKKTKQYSSRPPVLKDGKYLGNGIDPRGWRRGGTAGRPSKIEWLLSSNGGITPRRW